MTTVDFSSSLTWAVLIAWIMSVVLHELGHGIVGYLGGDYTLRERGGLTLNPLQYIDPFFSLLIPALIFVLGGLPLPGGVTYVRMDLIKSRLWQSAVSLAGPAINVLIFLACALPLHHKIGWMHPAEVNGVMPNLYLFLGAFALLQLLAVLLNLVPVPGLDGFGVIRPWLPHEINEKLSQPQIRRALFFLWFLVLWQVPAVIQWFYMLIDKALIGMGFSFADIHFFTTAFNQAVFGAS